MRWRSASAPSSTYYILAKTDRIDAKLLALFAQREQPALRPPLDAEAQALQELATGRDQLREMRVAEQQRLQRAGAQVRKEGLKEQFRLRARKITRCIDDRRSVLTPARAGYLLVTL